MTQNGIPNLSGLLREYYGQLLAEDSLSDLEVILLSLYIITNEKHKPEASYDEVKTKFVSLGRKVENFRANLSNAKKNNLVNVKDSSISFLPRGLKKVEMMIGKIEKLPVYIIKAGEQFTGIKRFEEFLKELDDGEILLVDPYVSPNTLFPFSILKGKLRVFKILTSNIYEEDKFREYKKKFEREINAILEVRINKKPHDRYLICGNKCWSIGTSIKDFGNKDTILHEMSEVKDSLQDLFDSRWNEAEKFE
ncbi:MAG: hypothetical protein QXQ53_04940 [Candidatus Methanosuratincola sp.]